jgi:hypothetical protein
LQNIGSKFDPRIYPTLLLYPFQVQFDLRSFALCDFPRFAGMSE